MQCRGHPNLVNLLGIVTENIASRNYKKEKRKTGIELTKDLISFENVSFL